MLPPPPPSTLFPYTTLFRSVHALRAIAAETFEFLLLKDAQQLGLKFQRNVTGFIEEERAAVGQLEAADFLIDGPGECATLMSEEFGFEKPGGDGGAIDLDESAISARTEVVNGAREEFLAGTGLAEKKNRRAGGSGKFNLPERALQRCAFADNLLEVKLAANFFFQVELLDRELVFQRVNFLER